VKLSWILLNPIWFNSISLSFAKLNGIESNKFNSNVELNLIWFNKFRLKFNKLIKSIEFEEVNTLLWWKRERHNHFIILYIYSKLWYYWLQISLHDNIDIKWNMKKIFKQLLAPWFIYNNSFASQIPSLFFKFVFMAHL